MAYVVVLLATRWGSELGGLNVFNKGLAEGMTQALPKGSQTICFVDQLSGDAGITAGLVEIFAEGGLNVAALVHKIAARCESMEQGTLQGVLVIGHDIVTGLVAVECAKVLHTRLQSSDVKSAVIAHMDYSEYAFKKNVDVGEVARRSTNQRNVIAEADCAFAVGPLLRRNFASARSVAHRPRSPVRPLIPGVGDIPISEFDERVGIRAFISGRLNREDDPIKNSVLAVEALAVAYTRGRESKLSAWQMRGQLFAWGVDPLNDAELITQLKKRGSDQAAFELQAVPFADDQTRLHQTLTNCHIALMPSWHEGFGLSGWEALCAGVPLVCSRQSGLAMLLDELTQQIPHLSLASVEFINIAGNTTIAAPSQQDINQLADVLLNMMRDIEVRKRAAINLAKLLKREFSWKRCASDLLGGSGWYFPGSVRWSARQMAARQTRSREVLERILSDLDGLDLEEDWGDLTTAFNELSDAGKHANLQNRLELRSDLRAIGHAVSTRIATSNAASETARNSWCMDVCWRFMAATANICQSFREFSESFPQTMLQVIWGDAFLTKELFYYASSFAEEFENQASEIVRIFFAPVRFFGETGALPTRLARLNSKHRVFAHVFSELTTNPQFVEESERCQQVRQHGHDIAQAIEKNPALASTALALMTIDLEPGRQVADQTVAFFKVYYPEAGRVKGHWRGDKRLFAALATASLSTRVILDALRLMAQDEDESIRWAALHLAFSPTLRQRLEAAVAAGGLSLSAPLNHILGQVVDAAVSTDTGHPWLHREFLSHYFEEQTPPVGTAMPTPLRVLDFPVARWLIGPVIGEVAPLLRGTSHPEVADTRTDTLQAVKRILLVLPPIEIDDNASGASRTSTPALGLGLLASHLAEQGHDVQIADCHRFPALRAEVLRVARTFDVIGFNTVFSTIRSTMKMLVDIRNRTQTTTLVVGGPAAKLNAWQFSTIHMEDAPFSWDFAIASDAVENLSAIVASLKTLGPWPTGPGIIANRQSWNVLARGLAEANIAPIRLPREPSLAPKKSAWLQVVLDRRVYRVRNEQYEPARTRSPTLNIHEAHVVMSQGCDWDCVFCTERMSKSGGEQRRAVAHVLSEIRLLAEQHPHVRIQFVDDNLLPQIAASAKSLAQKYEALGWSSDFLEGLANICAAANGSFGWRGIFRIEDFFAYETKFTDGSFVEKLQRSGCRMLAFGIEHGNEEQRRKNKVGNSVIDNNQIKDLFLRLRMANILTKAYFMLGGPWETHETARQTINFAIESGATLAYFALYKDFARATTVLSKEQESGDLAEGYTRYDQLAVNWDQAFAIGQTGQCGAGGSREMISGPATASELACYQQVAELGFRFSDLVKYNDFHSEDAHGGKLLRNMTWDSPPEYFTMVEKAYREFYLRPDFVPNYSALLAHGY